jgi:hypothetical protein
MMKNVTHDVFNGLVTLPEASSRVPELGVGGDTEGDTVKVQSKVDSHS